MDRAEPTPKFPPAVLPGYFADPTLVEFDGVFYIYPTTDGIADWGASSFCCWSSHDLITWKKEGIILDLGKDTTWAKAHAWAPTIARRNGRYYFYFTAEGKIGVAVSDKPTGPFEDAIGRPLIEKNSYDCYVIDPMVFIDDDGKAWLYFGNGKCNAALLNDDMISFASEPVKITPKGEYGEGPFVLKRKGVYYLMWSEHDTRDPRYCVCYARSDSPTGPFERAESNPILKGSGPVKGAGHHSVLCLPGSDNWLICYHRFAIPDGDGFHREVCINPLCFAANGDIVPVDVLAGVKY